MTSEPSNPSADGQPTSGVRAQTLALGPGDRIVRGLLRTPLLYCRVVGNRLITVYVVGRKSRRHYNVPVAYTPPRRHPASAPSVRTTFPGRSFRLRDRRRPLSLRGPASSGLPVPAPLPVVGLPRSRPPPLAWAARFLSPPRLALSVRALMDRQTAPSGLRRRSPTPASTRARSRFGIRGAALEPGATRPAATTDRPPPGAVAGRWIRAARLPRPSSAGGGRWSCTARRSR